MFQVAGTAACAQIIARSFLFSFFLILLLSSSSSFKLSHCFLFLFVCLFCCCFYYRIHTKVLRVHINISLKQNEAQSTRADSTRKGDNQRWKDVTQTQQQRPESPTVTLTWHACEYKVRKLHLR